MNIRYKKQDDNFVANKIMVWMNDGMTRYFIYTMSTIGEISMFNYSESSKILLCPIQIVKKQTKS